MLDQILKCKTQNYKNPGRHPKQYHSGQNNKQRFHDEDTRSNCNTSKNVQWDPIKLKSFCTVNNAINKVRRN